MQLITSSRFDALQSALRRITQEHEVDGASIPVVSGAVVVPDIIEPEAARGASSTLFTRGPDLVSSLSAVVSTDPVQEVVVGDLDTKFAIFRALRESIDAVIKTALEPKNILTELQARVYDGEYIGHPRHQDEQLALERVSEDADEWLTSVSTSIPISIPSQSTVEFIMHLATGDVVQSKVGSVAFFGPLVEHTTPVQRVDGKVIWLTALSIIRFNAGP